MIRTQIERLIFLLEIEADGNLRPDQAAELNSLLNLQAIEVRSQNSSAETANQPQ